MSAASLASCMRCASQRRAETSASENAGRSTPVPTLPKVASWRRSASRRCELMSITVDASGIIVVTLREQGMSMAETTLLVTGGMIYDHEADTDRPASADILVRGGRIAEVAPKISLREKADETLDARGMLVLPGFVNAHYHSHDVLMKGA